MGGGVGSAAREGWWRRQKWLWLLRQTVSQASLDLKDKNDRITLYLSIYITDLFPLKSGSQEETIRVSLQRIQTPWSNNLDGIEWK